MNEVELPARKPLENTRESAETKRVSSSSYIAGERRYSELNISVDEHDEDAVAQPPRCALLISFLESDGENLDLNRFKLICSYEDLADGGDSVLESWIDALVRRRVRHLDFEVDSDYNELVWMPLSLYSCNTLVSLSLCHVFLCGFELASAVSLPCLKVMRLDRVSTVIHSIAPYASVYIDVNFDGEDGYSSLDQDHDDDDDDSNSKEDYDPSSMIPHFSNLYASFDDLFWELLPTFLGCCPNLHTLVLEFEFDKEGCPMKLSSVPPCFVSSLKYVELATQDTTSTSSQVELARYFLSNCAALKKLTLSKSFPVDIIKKIKRIRRKSRRCIIVTD
ncbi:hypothetical protein Bca52824_015604 [Brassica carinata]|uniref:FBD domain-containing protein n=1 Tax=Brassica carinata TaxID=52824 RepID=A0A8X7W3I0_BRACI|nr:hypothetical protein Bca52824_015604 [Brassica carinata]